MADSIVQSDGGGQGEGLQTELATGNDHRLSSDLSMIRRAIREGWPIPPDKKTAVVSRLLGIVDKTQIEVMTKKGPAWMDGPADANAIKAASVLVAMSAETQRDIHAEDKNARLDAGKATEAVQYQAPPIHELPLPPHLICKSLPPPREE